MYFARSHCSRWRSCWSSCFLLDLEEVDKPLLRVLLFLGIGVVFHDSGLHPCPDCSSARPPQRRAVQEPAEENPGRKKPFPSNRPIAALVHRKKRRLLRYHLIARNSTSSLVSSNAPTVRTPLHMSMPKGWTVFDGPERRYSDRGRRPENTGHGRLIHDAPAHRPVVRAPGCRRAS